MNHFYAKYLLPEKPWKKCTIFWLSNTVTSVRLPTKMKDQTFSRLTENISTPLRLEKEILKTI